MSTSPNKKHKNRRKNIWEKVDWSKNEVRLFTKQKSPTKINLGIDLSFLSKKISVVCNFFFRTWVVESIDFENSIVLVKNGDKKHTIYIEDVNLAYYDKKRGILKKKFFNRYFIGEQRSNIQRHIKRRKNK